MEYVLGLDIATVISSLLIFFFGSWKIEPVFMISTEIIFILAILSLAFTFLYYMKVGKNNSLLIPSLILLGIGVVLTFFSWFIGGLIALLSLLGLLLSKEMDRSESRRIVSSYAGLAILAIMPPLGVLFTLRFMIIDYIIITIGIILVVLGIFLSLKKRKNIEEENMGFILLSLSFLFLAPSHELFGIHSNGTYGIYDMSIFILSSIVFFIFLGNFLILQIKSRGVMMDIEKGYKFMESGKYPEAAMHFKRAYQFLPDDEKVLNGLGVSLMKMGKYNESEQHLRKLARITNDKVYKTNLGNLYFRTGRIDKAMEIYQEVLKDDPNFYNALNNLARCYMEKGDYEKARELLEKAIEVDSDKKAAKVNYYFLLTSLGMEEEASKYKMDIGGLIE